MTRIIVGLPITVLGAGLLRTGHEYSGWIALGIGLLILLGELAMDLLTALGSSDD